MTEDVTSPPSATAAPPARESVEAQLAAWSRKLDRYLEQADRSVAIGRELVEQRALNIDLQRQIHRLEDELQTLRSKIAATGTNGLAREGQDGLLAMPAGEGRGRSPFPAAIRKIFGR